MLQLVTCEFKKLKKSNILWIIIAGAFFSAFVTFMQFKMALSIDDQVSDFEEFYLSAIWNNFCMSFPFVITIMGGMLCNQEYSSGTLKSIITIPVSIKRLYIAKIIITGVLVLALSVINYFFVIAGANLLHLQGIESFLILKAFLQILGMGIFIFTAVLPLIIWGFRKINGYYPMIVIAFMYGFCGSFLLPRGVGDFYPITAGLRIVKYADLPEGSTLAAVTTVAMMVLISILMIWLVPYSYESATQNKNVKKQHN